MDMVAQKLADFMRFPNIQLFMSSFSATFLLQQRGPLQSQVTGCHPHKVLSLLDDLPIFQSFYSIIFQLQYSIISWLLPFLSTFPWVPKRIESSEACDFEDVEGAAPEHFRL